MKNKSDVLVMLKEAFILLVITLFAGAILGFVYELTKEPIRIQQENAVKQACNAVFTQAQNFEETEYTITDSLSSEFKENGVEVGAVYRACDSDMNVLGYVIEATSHEGYGGDIVLYLGITNDGTLNDISILEIAETAGLGMRAEEVLVPQFHNKKVDSFSYTKTGSVNDNEIDAISGATVTTKAVTNAVNAGLSLYENILIGGEGNE